MSTTDAEGVVATAIHSDWIKCSDCGEPVKVACAHSPLDVLAVLKKHHRESHE